MSLKHTVQAFRCTDLAAFKDAMKTAATKLGGEFDPNRKPEDHHSKVLVAQGPNAISLVCGHVGGNHNFVTNVSWALNGASYLEGRVQEGSHWDYSIARGGQHLDSFSTFPQYYAGPDDLIEILYTQGWPEMLSLAFGVPAEKFERYLRHWYSGWDERIQKFRTKLEGKAYPADRWQYGDYKQLWDFLRSLGIHDPFDNVPKQQVWTLILPDTPQRSKG